LHCGHESYYTGLLLYCTIYGVSRHTPFYSPERRGKSSIRPSRRVNAIWNQSERKIWLFIPSQAHMALRKSEEESSQVDIRLLVSAWPMEEKLKGASRFQFLPQNLQKRLEYVAEHITMFYIFETDTPLTKNSAIGHHRPRMTMFSDVASPSEPCTAASSLMKQKARRSSASLNFQAL